MRDEEGFPLQNEGMMFVNVIWLGREIYTGSQKSGSITTGKSASSLSSWP